VARVTGSASVGWTDWSTVVSGVDAAAGVASAVAAGIAGPVSVSAVTSGVAAIVAVVSGMLSGVDAVSRAGAADISLVVSMASGD